MMDAKGFTWIQEKTGQVHGRQIHWGLWNRDIFGLGDSWASGILDPGALRVFWGNVTKYSFFYNLCTTNNIGDTLLGQKNLFSSPVKLPFHHNFSQRGELRGRLLLGSYIKHQTRPAKGQHSVIILTWWLAYILNWNILKS